MIGGVGRKILAVVGSVVSVGLVVLMLFYAERQQQVLLAQNERTLVTVTEGVIQALRTVMLAGYADISQQFGDHLKHVADVADLRILRSDGTEAFRDNATIAAVNQTIGTEHFRPRFTVETVPVLQPDDQRLRAAADRGDTVTYYERGADGSRLLTLLAPITSQDACQACHTDGRRVRGVLKLTTSLAHLDHEIVAGWIQAGAVTLLTVVAILVVVGVVVRRSVVASIETVTGAMVRASHGDLAHEVPVTGADELGQMACSFNTMMRQLSGIYSGLRHEQNKLTTILLGARDGIVVTDGDGRVCLVNPAAEELLGKSAEEIAARGFLDILDDPAWAKAQLGVPLERHGPQLVAYKDRMLSAYMASIRGDDGTLVGSAALLRDITEEKRLQDELERLSVTDPLTGLFNRRYFDQKLGDEFQLALRYGQPLSVLLFDIDHFKRFNDTYGHDQGDRVLRAIAELTRRRRTADIACRYGGEEFALILPNTPVDRALLAAERLRQAVADAEVDGLKVTISVGLAGRPPLMADRTDDLVKAADRALYAAKHAGRNRVSQWTAPPTQPVAAD